MSTSVVQSIDETNPSPSTLPHDFLTEKQADDEGIIRCSKDCGCPIFHICCPDKKICEIPLADDPTACGEKKLDV